MYHRLLNILIATQDKQIVSLLQDVAPLDQFSHQITYRQNFDEAALDSYAIIIIDFCTDEIGTIKEIHAAKNEQTILIGCISADNLSAIAEVHDLLDQVWIRPFLKEKILASFAKIQILLKGREDAALANKYLDTLIDSLPDLIWFKDVRGAHLKVNDSFCRTVDKTKAEIQGRGHYYIWGMEPDEYAQGEYVCLESEETVLNRKETCLFDETVKCHGELRKFKTYKSPIFDADGGVIGTVGFAHDVTDLQNLLVELNILLESLPFAVMITDKDRNITSVNQKFIDLISLQRTELIGGNIDDFIDGIKQRNRNESWTTEYGEEEILFLSQNLILKIHDEKLLDIFGTLAGHIVLFFNVTLEHSLKSKLLMDANTDYLTDLNNRRSLQDFLRKTPCQRNTALLLADLDNFKEVNDQYGHDEGDRVLVAFSSLLQRFFPVESLFRLGGDEFAIILPEVEDVEILRSYAEKLLAGFDEKIVGQFPQTNISLSIGIAMDVGDSENFGELFKRADIALYEAKKSKQSAFKFWKSYLHGT